MRQIAGTLFLIAILLALWTEACSQFCGITMGFPILRGIAIFTAIMYLLYFGEACRRESNAKKKKIKQLKLEKQKAEWIAEYEAFRAELHK